MRRNVPDVRVYRKKESEWRTVGSKNENEPLRIIDPNFAVKMELNRFCTVSDTNQPPGVTSTNHREKITTILLC